MVIKILVNIIFLGYYGIGLAAHPAASPITGPFGKVHPVSAPGTENASERTATVALILKISDLGVDKSGVSYKPVAFAQEWVPTMPVGADSSLEKAEHFLRPALAGLIGLCPKAFLGLPEMYKLTLKLEPASPDRKDKGMATAGAGTGSPLAQ